MSHNKVLFQGHLWRWRYCFHIRFRHLLKGGGKQRFSMNCFGVTKRCQVDSSPDNQWHIYTSSCDVEGSSGKESSNHWLTSINETIRQEEAYCPCLCSRSGSNTQSSSKSCNDMRSCVLPQAEKTEGEWRGLDRVDWERRGAVALVPKPQLIQGWAYRAVWLTGYKFCAYFTKGPVKRIWGMRAAAYLKWSSNAVPLRVTGAWQQRRVEL